MFRTASLALGSAVETDGTFTVAYPSGTTAASFAGGFGHILSVYATDFTSPDDFTVSFGSSNITVTWLNDQTLASGALVGIQFNGLGGEDAVDVPGITNAYRAAIVRVSLGVPAAADDDKIATAQAVATAKNLTKTATTVSFDVPRGVQIVSAGAGDTTQTATFTGTDAYGVALTETLTLDGTTPVLGKKAFKTVSQVAISAATAGNVKAGSTDVLGLPIFIAEAADVVSVAVDGAADTFAAVAGSTATPTATTGDVRGTVDPGTACNASKRFTATLCVLDADSTGGEQA